MLVSNNSKKLGTQNHILNFLLMGTLIMGLFEVQNVNERLGTPLRNAVIFAKISKMHHLSRRG